MEVADKCVLVVGSGISGISAVKLLEKLGAEVILYDGNEELDLEQIRAKVNNRALEIVLGKLENAIAERIDLVVISPGVPTDIEVIKGLKERNIPIWGEVELAFVYGKGDVLAITGTNGKTTTTALVGEIMKRWKPSTYVVGNIGVPYTDVVLEMCSETVTVAEMSSFQLETIHTFRPKVSAILNIAPDHLDRHYTMEAYIKAKMEIAKNQTKEDTCVLNYEDEVTRKFGEELGINVIFFSSKHILDQGVYLDEGNIIYKKDEAELLCHVDELQLLGMHNYENVMAAVAIAIAYGTPIAIVRDAIKAFGGVAHRIEYVAEKKGVLYYNDSKGTNIDAAIKGIQAMKRPTVLIGGGYDKDATYEEWIQAFEGKVKHFILFGDTKEKIAVAAEKCGFTQVFLVDTFEEAIEKAVELAEPGDAVLLSPACASWGMFRNYEERGDRFKELVNDL